MERQYSDTILMIRPANFGFNQETAENNVFQDAHTDLTDAEVKNLAKEEFDNMVKVLRDEGVNILVIDDSEQPLKTDAVFPNNWISTHADGSLYLFPMFSPNRRLERRMDIVDQLAERFKVTLDNSLVRYEKDDLFLEGTGSMILDRPNKIIYACYSERTHQELLNKFSEKIGYEVCSFHAVDDQGIPYYHTNVIMTLGEHVAILCTESIEDIKERNHVLNSLRKSGKQIVEISRDQVLAFAGNMLEIQGKEDANLMVMSEAAYHSLQKDQLYIIKKYNKIVYLPLYNIEHFGGGSARCMIAEIFLPILK